MALTQREKEKYEFFIGGLSKNKLKHVLDDLKMNYVFFSQAKNIAKSEEAEKHYTKEKTDNEDMIKIIEGLLKNS